jgi:hypothetical protein
MFQLGADRQAVNGVQPRVRLEEFRDGRLDEEGDPWRDLQRLHVSNHTIWHFEDEARRDDVSDVRIVTIKRGIDAVNQKRNDQMEIVDEYFVNHVQTAGDEVPLHTEPPGLIADRLSFMCLKIYHYAQQSKSEEVEALTRQRQDLAGAFDDFIRALRTGDKQVKIYRQYKTYNDPDTNPALSTDD